MYTNRVLTSFPWGPTVDGVLIKNLPALELAASPPHIWQGLNSIVVTHVADEGKSFVPPEASMNTEANWKVLVGAAVPKKIDSSGGSPDLLDAAYQQYAFPTHFANEQASLDVVIGAYTILCNVRLIINAYRTTLAGHVYSAQVDFLPDGSHGTDILNLISGLSGTNTGKYRRFLLSHAATGDPNFNSNVYPPFPLGPDSGSVWSPISWANNITNILHVSAQDFSTNFQDNEDASAICTYWNSFQASAVAKIPIGL
jgi:hypothetical protein